MFQFIMPDILGDMRELSVGAVTLGFSLGLFLWVFGWWSHRFWVVLITTILAGNIGLYESSAFQVQPLLAGLLLALSAGLLAMAMVRVMAFLAGGLAGLWILQAVVPNFTQAVIVFLLCGIFSLLLFRVWMMGITATSGCLLATYCGLSLLDRAGSMDAVAWTGQGAVLLNWVIGILVVVGITLQYVLDRRSRKKADSEKKKDKEPKDAWDVIAARTWGKYRKAG